MFDGFDGDNMLIMWPFEGTTCCSIVLRFVVSGGELDAPWRPVELVETFAGTNETNVEPSELVIKLFDCFIFW